MSYTVAFQIKQQNQYIQTQYTLNAKELAIDD